MSEATTAVPLPVVGALAARGIINVFRVPGAIVPTLAMPIFFLISFSGSFAGVTMIPGFPTDKIINWVMPFAIIQGSAFAGLGSAFSVARDIENGFYDRLLLAPVRRSALVLGPVAGAMLRALIPLTIVFALATLAGARLTDGLLGLVTLSVAAVCIAGVSALWGLGVVYRLKTQRALSLVQVGIFVSMFLSPGQVPVVVMEGWLHGIARVNPLTNVLRLAREGFLGAVTWHDTWGGLVALVAMAVFMSVFAMRGLRTMVP